MEAVSGSRWKQWVWSLAPVVVLLALTAPLVGYRLPDTRSTLSEEYQPLKALKFFAARGRTFHKWGPVDNFLLAPGYGATMLYWKASGKFLKPSDTFPYGFVDPLQQLSTLILQSRMVVLGMGLAAVLVYTLALRRLAAGAPWAAGLAMLLVVATNPIFAFHLVALKADVAMTIFSALSLAVYLRIVVDGLTWRRAIWFGVFAATAMAAKESAAPLLGLAAAYVVVRESWGRGGRRRMACAVVLAFVVSYLLVAVVYAPGIWWERMQFWFAGPGMATGVWADSRTGFWSLLVIKGKVLLDNLGPAGTVAAIAAVGWVVLQRPGKWGALMLPAVGFAIGLLKVGYAPDYFAHPMSLAVAPVVTLALAGWMKERGCWAVWKPAVVAVMVLVNFYYAQIAWIKPYGSADMVIERDAARLEGATFNVLSLFPMMERTRLKVLGYSHDTRPLATLIADGTEKLPAYVYQVEEDARWLADFPNRPERARMVQGETGFDYRAYPGLEAWGYRLKRTITRRLPGWYMFDFMPITQEQPVIRLYEREGAEGRRISSSD